MAVIASRSSLIGALLRGTPPVWRHITLNFLRGLSRDELEVIAEFQGSFLLEAEYSGARNPYLLLPEFFEPEVSSAWQNAEDKAHKTFVVMGYLDHLAGSVCLTAQPASLEAA